MRNLKKQFTAGFIPRVSATPAMANVQRSRLRAVRILVLSACMFLSAPARAGDLTEQVRNTVDRVLTIVKSSQPISKVQVEARRVQLADAINPTFDFTDVAKRSLGRHWAGRRPEEQREFVTIFGPLSGPLRPRTAEGQA